MPYTAAKDRYTKIPYKRCGKSGIKLPIISLGLWHNFGDVDVYENSRKMLLTAFDNGITHFDLANNYGPSPGSAEETFGKVMEKDLKPYRDHLIISSKAGYWMWDGPYGEWGSRKYLISSCDQSLKRMGLDYVDIFYHHRPDYETPLEESMMALDQIVRSGKALYAGISNYPADRTAEAAKIMRELGTPLLIHQPKYSMFERWIEPELISTLASVGMGAIVFSPLAQGLLTDKYIDGIPDNSRAAKSSGFLQVDEITEERINKVKALKEIAAERGQSIAQLAISWVLRHDEVTSALIGASKVEHVLELIRVQDKLEFTEDELIKIDEILK
ncbi:MAG: aldo/keto reductase [Melioribacteraceae bacterium]|nr:aldo/keto reductase [Melioribacteraceae bacterium]MCF8354765.1 aldo/keto reductase [Melioribacteraceae bacterium]MCF8394390.1 aldo/keto reductase [Melioribacteraceae bacterium]MCF8417514.1 aldo/keto reductase [Melioribacteraceae bacterium]